MKFTLVLKPNGKALLVTPEHIPPEALETLRRLWDEWSAGHRDVLFVSGVDVRLVEDIELRVEDHMADQATSDKDMNAKSDMQRTAEQAQRDTEQNQRDQMSPNARDDAAEAGKAQVKQTENK